MVRGIPRGYLLDPTKRILVVSPRNFPRVEVFFWGCGFKFVMSSRYLGGFVGKEEAQAQWLYKKVEGWKFLV